MDADPLAMGNMMGGLLKWLTDEMKEMKAWREECKAEMVSVNTTCDSLKKKCETLQLRSIQQKMGILKTQGRILEAQTCGSMRAIFFKKLKGYLRLNIGKRRRKSQAHSNMLVVLSSSSICMRQRYFTKWLRWNSAKMELKKKIRQCMAIQLQSENYGRSIYFDLLKKYRARNMVRRVLTDRLSRVTKSATLRLHYTLLLRYSRNRLLRKSIEAAVVSMSACSHAALLKISWRKLQKHANLTSLTRTKSIYKTRALTTFIKTTERGMRLYAYRSWMSFVHKRRTRTQQQFLADVSRKVNKLTEKVTTESETIREIKKTITHIEEKVGSSTYQKKEDEFMASMKFSISENERSIHLLDTKCREVESQSASSLRDAMREVDDIISSMKSDQVNHSRQAKSSLLTSLTALEEETSKRLIKLEKTLADLLTADRHQIKHDFDARTESLSHEFSETRAQVDLSLKSLANTNSVLNKVVNRMITIDHQLEELDKTATTQITQPRDISPTRQHFDPLTGRPLDEASLHRIRRHE